MPFWGHSFIHSAVPSSYGRCMGTPAIPFRMVWPFVFLVCVCNYTTVYNIWSCAFSKKYPSTFPHVCPSYLVETVMSHAFSFSYWFFFVSPVASFPFCLSLLPLYFPFLVSPCCWSLLAHLSFPLPAELALERLKRYSTPCCLLFQVLCCLVSLSHQAGWDGWLGLGREREPLFHNSIDDVLVDMATMSKGP